VLARAPAQVKLKTSCASTGATNAIWNRAKERGCDKKHGLDVGVAYISVLIGMKPIAPGQRFSSAVHIQPARACARAANPASKLSVDDIVDDGIVRELEKDGFIDRLYR
jgi:hypothetical protein